MKVVHLIHTAETRTRMSAAHRAAELKLLAEKRLGAMRATLPKASGGDRKSAKKNQIGPSARFDSGKEETSASEMRVAHLGKTFSAEHRAKLSAARKMRSAREMFCARWRLASSLFSLEDMEL